MGRRTLRTTVALWSGLCLVATASVIIGYSAVSVRSMGIEDARERLADQARKEAAGITLVFDRTLGACRTLAETFSAVKDNSAMLDIGRDEVNAILRRVLSENPSFVAVYSLWEPNGFDDLDSGYAGTEGHDASGRFAPYWRRPPGGGVEVASLLGISSHCPNSAPGQWYDNAKSTMREMIMDPFSPAVRGERATITSVVVPVVANDVFYGIVGIDLGLGIAQERADQVLAFNKSGESGVISHNGTLAAVTGRPELAGKHMKEVHEDWREDLQHVQNADEVIKDDDGRIAVFTPVMAGRTATPWSVYVRIPVAGITARAATLMWTQIAIGSGCVVLALILMWITVSKFVTRRVSAETSGLQTASLQLKAASEQQLAGAAEQTAATGEVSATMNELATTAGQITERCRQVTKIAEQAAARCDEGGESVQQAQTVMAEIKGQIEKIVQHMLDLGDKSQQINLAVDVIAELSEQTTILSYNAAIEAASVGEAGQAFAVVADQVGKLADRAKEAARDVRTLIEDIQKSTNTTIMATEDGLKAASRGLSTQQEVSEKVVRIRDEIGSTLGAVREIEMSSTQQSTAAEQVKGGMENITCAARESEASSKQLLGTAEQLTTTAKNLDNL